MDFVGLIIFLLCVYGTSNIVVFSSGPFRLFEHLRDFGDKLPSNLGEMFHCMICFPTWIGMGLSLLNMFLFENMFITPFYSLTHSTEFWYIIMLLDGFTASGGNWLIHTIQEFLEKDE